MDKREWLAEQGLAEIGKRGRFSKEANEAWAKYISESGIVIEANLNATPKPTEPEEVPESHYDGFRYARRTPPEKAPVRKENSAYAVGAYGTLINFGNCFGCKERIQFCECADGPDGPSYVPKQKMYVFVKP